MIFLMLLAVAAFLILFWKSPEREDPRISRRRSHGAQHHPDVEPIELVLDLGANLMDAGLPIPEVLDTLGHCIPQCSTLRTVARCLELNMEWQRAWEQVPAWLDPLRRALGFAHTTGAPAANLLRSTAGLQRREREQRVARLGSQFATRLVLPLGACALPSFIALGVIPLIIALFPQL